MPDISYILDAATLIKLGLLVVGLTACHAAIGNKIKAVRRRGGLEDKDQSLIGMFLIWGVALGVVVFLLSQTDWDDERRRTAFWMGNIVISGVLSLVYGWRAVAHWGAISAKYAASMDESRRRNAARDAELARQERAGMLTPADKAEWQRQLSEDEEWERGYAEKENKKKKAEKRERIRGWAYAIAIVVGLALNSFFSSPAPDGSIRIYATDPAAVSMIEAANGRLSGTGITLRAVDAWWSSDAAVRVGGSSGGALPIFGTAHIEAGLGDNGAGLLHELIHTAGYNHDKDPNSLMYQELSSVAELRPEHIKALRRLPGITILGRFAGMIQELF
jgi:hypothetical protein